LKSTGPKSPKGKGRSRLNSLKHGLSANLDSLPGESMRAHRARLDRWASRLEPRDALDRTRHEQAVRLSWRLDRSERRYVAKVTCKAATADSERAEAIAHEVLALYRRRRNAAGADPNRKRKPGAHEIPGGEGDVTQESQTG
jgi:hypothetical protein